MLMSDESRACDVQLHLAESYGSSQTAHCDTFSLLLILYNLQVDSTVIQSHVYYSVSAVILYMDTSSRNVAAFDIYNTGVWRNASDKSSNTARRTQELDSVRSLAPLQCAKFSIRRFI